jgi:hypothetical protein
MKEQLILGQHSAKIICDCDDPMCGVITIELPSKKDSRKWSDMGSIRIDAPQISSLFSRIKACWSLLIYGSHSECVYISVNDDKMRSVSEWISENLGIPSVMNWAPNSKDSFPKENEWLFLMLETDISNIPTCAVGYCKHNEDDKIQYVVPGVNYKNILSWAYCPFSPDGWITHKKKITLKELRDIMNESGNEQ